MEIRIKPIVNGYIVKVGYLDGAEWYFKQFDDLCEFLAVTGKQLVSAESTDDLEQVIR